MKLNLICALALGVSTGLAAQAKGKTSGDKPVVSKAPVQLFELQIGGIRG